VLQEALSNVAKHADATHAEVTLTNEDGCLKLMIKDDGKSFDASKAFAKRKPKRLGLLGMRERIEMVGGRFTVESHPNQGTCVKAEIPYLSPRQTHGRE
jgi:signal transduction histidine kinase